MCDDNQADEKRLTKITLPNIKKAMAVAMELTDFINDIDPFMGLSLLGMDDLFHPHKEVQKDLRKKMCQPDIISFLKNIKVKFHAISKYVYCITFDMLNSCCFCDIFR
jgi:hypothetical protein